MINGVAVIEQTNYCGLHCIGCPNRLNQRPKGYMKHNDFISIINQLAEYDKSILNCRITLHGFGDVFMNPDFFSNLGYLCSRGFTNVDFHTNGMLLNENNINELTKYNCLNHITISLNSSNKRIAEVVNTGSDFDLVVNNVKSLINNKYRKFIVQIQKFAFKDTRDEKVSDFINLLSSKDFVYCEKVYHDYYSQIPDGITNQRLLCCIHNSYMEFGGPLPFVQWNGDMAGCCGDDTKSQIYGNALKDGVFSDKTIAIREKLNNQLQNRDFTNLPLCKRCLSGRNAENMVIWRL